MDIRHRIPTKVNEFIKSTVLNSVSRNYDYDWWVLVTLHITRTHKAALALPGGGYEEPP